MEITIEPKPINKENFSKFGELVTAEGLKSVDINNGYAKRFGEAVKLDTRQDRGETTISIFSALKRTFPMKINMMEQHPLGSQAFIPMKETTFLCFVAPPGESPDISKIQSFIVPPKNGINYKPGIWHFPLISTEDTNFLVIDRKGKGENLIIHKFEKEKIILSY